MNALGTRSSCTDLEKAAELRYWHSSRWLTRPVCPQPSRTSPHPFQCDSLVHCCNPLLHCDALHPRGPAVFELSLHVIPFDATGARLPVSRPLSVRVPRPAFRPTLPRDSRHAFPPREPATARARQHHRAPPNPSTHPLAHLPPSLTLDRHGAHEGRSSRRGRPDG